MRNEELLLEFFPLHVLHWSSHKGRSISDFLMSSWRRCLFSSLGWIVLVEQRPAVCNSPAQTQLLALWRWTHIWNITHHQEHFPVQQRMEQALHNTNKASRKRWKGTGPLWNDVYWVSADFLAESFPVPSQARQCWHTVEGGAAAALPPRSAREGEKQAGHICSSLVQGLAACKSHAGEREGSLPSPGSTAGPSM